ncbi:flagellar motor stator protein MotA [Radicibacter daui]|uniref:flagellar motor stator protein MotA n=1 Tax=Radicibacter daui TaxID=3064829 RepID=UPI004046B0B9
MALHQFLQGGWRDWHSGDRSGMFAIIGVVTTIVTVFGGFVWGHGRMGMLWVPPEYFSIFGMGAGVFFFSNPKSVAMGAMKAIGKVFKGASYHKAQYLELLTMMYQVFKVAKTKGLLALEAHIEKPEESSIFQAFPNFHKNHHAVAFFCDYLRLMSLGTETPHELEAIMDQELETEHKEHHALSHALQHTADSLPAIGIVVAVMGVIKTMGSITEPPEVLGELIGGALVGTFSGVFAGYGFLGPIANNLGQIYDSDGKYFQCMKAGLIAHVSGYAPAISVEFARKTLEGHNRPSFQELEEATQNLPAAS